MGRNCWLMFGILFMVIFLLHGVVQATADETANKPVVGDKQDNSVEELAKKSQNPVSDLMSVPFQYNVYSGGALGNSTKSVLNIQPVIPHRLNKDWNLRTRIVLPLMSSPTPNGMVSGTGDSTICFFLSPHKKGEVMMGFGPIVQLPTASNEVLGTQTWGIGPAALVVKSHKQWVYGAMTNYVTSIGNSPTGHRTDQLLIQLFANYNLPHAKGFSLSYSPMITADFTRAPGDQWTLPVGLMATKVLHIGKQPVSIGIGGFKNVVRPSNAPDWNFRFAMTFLFPE